MAFSDAWEPFTALFQACGFFLKLIVVTWSLIASEGRNYSMDFIV